MSVGDDTYLFVKNLQGDITKILDSSGDVLVSYTYDAWGKVLSTKNGNGQNITDQSSIAFLNPFRYRGYVYDSETQLYYLQSRYYDPITGRFINADSPAYTDTFSGSPLSTNMFAYCENNPVMMSDTSGKNAYLLLNSNAVNSYEIMNNILNHVPYHEIGYAISKKEIEKLKRTSFGHISIMIQTSKKVWWYFYWAGERKQLMRIELNNTHSLSEINTVLNQNGCIGGDYTHKLLLMGDFTNSLKYIHKKLFNVLKLKNIDTTTATAEYNLFKRNCAQISIDSLCRGNISRIKIKALKKIRKLVIPNIIFLKSIIL